MTVLPLILAAVLAPLMQAELPRSGVSDKDLGKLTKSVEEFFAALEVDDRGEQKSSLEEIEENLAKSAKRAKVKDDILRYVGDWDQVLEAAKDDKAIKSKIGKGFFVHVFEDTWNDTSTAALLSLPADFKSGDLMPVILALKPVMGLSGSELEDAVQAQAEITYADVMDSHIVLVPLGHQQTSGRKPSTEEVDGSWMTPLGNEVFFTCFRILFEQVRFDRGRVVLDGWGEAGLDALRLGTNAPSFFAGVLVRGGAVESPEIVYENLHGIQTAYIRGDESPDDVSALTELDLPGVEVTVVAAGGSALDPSDDGRAALREWISTCDKDLAPREVRYRPTDVVYGSSNWIQASVVNRRAAAVPGDKDFPLMHARIDAASNTIEIETINVLELRVFLSDALVDMDRPVTINVNGEEAWRKVPQRSLRHLLENRFYSNSGDYGLYTANAFIEGIAPNVPGRDG